MRSEGEAASAVPVAHKRLQASLIGVQSGPCGGHCANGLSSSKTQGRGHLSRAGPSLLSSPGFGEFVLVTQGWDEEPDSAEAPPAGTRDPGSPDHLQLSLAPHVWAPSCRFSATKGGTVSHVLLVAPHRAPAGCLNSEGPFPSGKAQGDPGRLPPPAMGPHICSNLCLPGNISPCQAGGTWSGWGTVYRRAVLPPTTPFIYLNSRHI